MKRLFAAIVGASLVTWPALAQLILTENVPFTLKAPFVSRSYQWSLGNVDLPGATNSTLVLESPLEGDAGTYRVRGAGGQSAMFKAMFQRSVRVQLDDREVIGDRVTVSKFPARLRLWSPLGPSLPIRYTLDGSEPTVRSALYTAPVYLTVGCVVRAAIVIPEGDSVRIESPLPPVGPMGPAPAGSTTNKESLFNKRAGTNDL